MVQLHANHKSMEIAKALIICSSNHFFNINQHKLATLFCGLSIRNSTKPSSIKIKKRKKEIFIFGIKNVSTYKYNQGFLAHSQYIIRIPLLSHYTYVSILMVAFSTCPTFQCRHYVQGYKLAIFYLDHSLILPSLFSL